jgi:L-ribulose-5-phosphate 3-epimerase
MKMSRRELLRRSAAVVGVAAVQAPLMPFVPIQESFAKVFGPDDSAKSRREKWEVGCFNRPWMKWSFDSALDGIKEAGFQQMGLVGDHKGEAFVSVQATPDYLSRLKERIESRGLSAIVAWLHITFDGGLKGAIAQSRKQVDNAQRVGLKYLLSGGVDRVDLYDPYYQVMADMAAYAQDRHIQVVVKPHGGCLAAAADILRCIEKVNHRNLRVWYDAGNIIYYTGKDPIADAQRLGQLVTGFCAKDCARPRSDVMIPFGAGKVDFKGVFNTLQRAGFNGPVMIECAGGRTIPEVTAGVRANRAFLEQVFSTLSPNT